MCSRLKRVVLSETSVTWETPSARWCLAGIWARPTAGLAQPGSAEFLRISECLCSQSGLMIYWEGERRCWQLDWLCCEMQIVFFFKCGNSASFFRPLVWPLIV